MGTAFNLRTKRAPDGSPPDVIAIDLPDAVASAIAAGAGVFGARDALWLTPVARVLGEAGDWAGFPPAAELTAVHDALVAPSTMLRCHVTGTRPTSILVGATEVPIADDRSDPIHVEVETPALGPQRRLMVHGGEDTTLTGVTLELAAPAPPVADEVLTALGEAVLLLKYGFKGIVRPLSAAIRTLRVAAFLRDRPATNDGRRVTDELALLNRPIVVPAALARPQPERFPAPRPSPSPDDPARTRGGWLDISRLALRRRMERRDAPVDQPTLGGVEDRRVTVDWSTPIARLTELRSGLDRLEALAVADVDERRTSTPAERILVAGLENGLTTRDAVANASYTMTRGFVAEGRTLLSIEIGDQPLLVEPGLALPNDPTQPIWPPPEQPGTPAPFDPALPPATIEGTPLLRPPQELLDAYAELQARGVDLVLGAPMLQPSVTYHGPSFLEPSGRSDLLLVKTTWNRYEPAEIAEVVNVLSGETRSTSRLREVRSMTETLFETEREEERKESSEVANRAELSQTASSIIEEDFRANGSVTITSQGGTVSTTVSGEVTTGTAVKEAAEAVEEYARSVTRRAEQVVRERVLEQRRTTLTVVERQESTGTFVAGEDDVVGIYRHVDLVAAAEVMRYGARTLYDVIIPEPAALLWDLAIRDTSVRIVAQEPDAEFFDSITVANVEGMRDAALERFGAIEIPPKPEEQTTAWSFSATGRGDNAKIAQSSDVQIPDGYQAISFSGQLMGERESGADIGLGIAVGPAAATRVDQAPGNNSWTRLGNGEQATLATTPLPRAIRGTLPVAIAGENFQSLAGTIVITVEPTEEALGRWRRETYNAIASAYERLRSRYEQARAEAEAFAPEETISLPEGASRRLADMMRFEVQRAVLAVMRHGHVDYRLIHEDVQNSGFPGPDLDALAVAAPEIQFLQQAFEWPEMSWILYPYLWGRRTQWPRTILQDHPDPSFAAFLRAGAARVQIPVRPGFEDLVAHFMETGEVYPDGIPRVGDPGRLSFIAEQLESFDAPGDESAWPEKDPLRWEVRLPTTHIVLDSRARTDGLPRNSA